MADAESKRQGGSESEPALCHCSLTWQEISSGKNNCDRWRAATRVLLVGHAAGRAFRALGLRAFLQGTAFAGCLEGSHGGSLLSGTWAWRMQRMLSFCERSQNMGPNVHGHFWWQDAEHRKILIFSCSFVPAYASSVHTCWHRGNNGKTAPSSHVADGTDSTSLSQ
jgi:hypothetical protein